MSDRTVMEWEEVEQAATRIHWGAFLATVDSANRPHVSFVSPGFSRERVWVVSDRDTAKVANLRGNPYVAIHWPVDPDDINLQLLVRGVALLHESPEKKQDLWDQDVVPWRLDNFHEGPDDPTLAFIEIQPSYASLAQAWGSEHKVWRR